MTESELRNRNPWKEVAEMYNTHDILYSQAENKVCACDRDMIEEFNKTAEDKHQYKLNVPAYPWYGNPLTAKVIVLSLNPGYVEKESVIAKILQQLPTGLVKGYTEHLRKILTFDCQTFMPENRGTGPDEPDNRDIANAHNSWYWEDRLKKGFVNVENGPTFEQVNRRFAVIQYIGYSSVKYHPFKGNKRLPSQDFTRDLIQYIVSNNKDTLFIVARKVDMWKKLLGDIWTDDRFIVSSDYLGQRFTPGILKESHPRIIAAFKA